MNPLKLFQKLKNNEENLIYDLEKDFQSNNFRLALKLYSEIGSSVLLLVLIGVIGILYGFQVFVLILLVYLFQLVLIEVIKYVFNRGRPKTYKNDSILGFRMTSGSFPSGHTSNAFAMAFLLANVFKTDIYTTTMFFIIAGVVGITRIFLGKHFLVDVVGGAILGLVFATVGLALYVAGYGILFQ